MSREWQINVPYRDRSEPVTAIADHASALADSEEGDVVRGLAMELVLTTDLGTVGAALDAIDRADPASRRDLLDRARERAGLPSTEAAEQIARYEAANASLVAQSGPLRDSQGRIEARCAEPRCNRFEPHPQMGGAAARVACRRWWCKEHRAGHEDDMTPYTGPRLGYSRIGLVVDLDAQEREQERARAQAESQRRQLELREATRRADAVEHAKRKRAAREKLQRELPRGVAAP
jgi:hypothetical protein